MDNFRQVAAMIKGKTPEELRKQFKITSDFTPEEEEQAMRSEGSGQLSFPSQQQSAGMRSVGGVGVSAGRGLGAIGGGGGLMSMEDDRRSDGSGSTSTSWGAAALGSGLQPGGGGGHLRFKLIFEFEIWIKL